MGEHLLEKLSIDTKTHTYPVFDAKALATDSVVMVVQVNGKVRGQMAVCADTAFDKDALIAMAKQADGVEKFLTGEIKKAIVVPNKLVSFVV